eukprot:gb/GECG01001078.1/.p1 GENE.gb/GECG01001078.1/~~gb/GECG01001078.1/.p1  ORF type:complete len:404 (+),score=54.57 gb/GECG01001078.1/:1-1212(+)
MDVTRLYRFLDQPEYRAIATASREGYSAVLDRTTEEIPPELLQPSQSYKSHLTLRYTKHTGAPFEKFEEGKGTGRITTPQDKNATAFGIESNNIDKERLGTPMDCDLLDRSLRDLPVSTGRPKGIRYDGYGRYRVNRAEPFDTEEILRTERPLTQEEKRAIEQGKQTAYDGGFLIFDENENRYRSPITSAEPGEDEVLKGDCAVKQRVPGLIAPDVRRKLNEQEVAAQKARRERRRLMGTESRRENILRTQYPKGITGPAARPKTDGNTTSTQKSARTQRIEKNTISMARRGYDILSGKTGTNGEPQEPKLMQSKVRREPPVSRADLKLGTTTFDRCFNQPYLCAQSKSRQDFQRNAMTRGRDYDIVSQQMLSSYVKPTTAPEPKRREEHPSIFATKRFVDRS